MRREKNLLKCFTQRYASLLQNLVSDASQTCAKRGEFLGPFRFDIKLLFKHNPLFESKLQKKKEIACLLNVE